MPAAGRALRVGLFLVEFLSQGRWQPLSAVTAPPTRAALPAADGGRPVAADLYTTVHPAGRPGLVVVHGLTAAGKDDARVREAAGLLARAGWAVAVPSVEGLMRLRLRPEDARAVVAAGGALREAGSGPIAILAVSVGAGPALTAAGDPSLAPSVSAVLTLGGYASARELLRFTLKGGAGRDAPAIAAFLAANPELADDASRRLAGNRDPGAVDALLADLSPPGQRLLEALSPERTLGRVRAPLFLVHGRDDPAVPVTESVRLAAAAGRAGRPPTRLVVVGAVGHVEPGVTGRLLDLARLGVAFYAFTVTSAGPAPSG